MVDEIKTPPSLKEDFRSWVETMRQRKIDKKQNRREKYRQAVKLDQMADRVMKPHCYGMTLEEAKLNVPADLVPAVSDHVKLLKSYKR